MNSEVIIKKMKKEELRSYIFDNMSKNMFRLLNAVCKQRYAKRFYSTSKLLQKNNLKIIKSCYVQKRISNDTLYAAIKRNDYEKIEYFLKFRTYYPYLLENTIMFGDYKSIKLILKTKNLDINADLGDGRSALNYVVTQGKLNIVALLIELGADVERKDSNDQTPLMIARSKNNLSMVDLLLSYGAKTK